MNIIGLNYNLERTGALTGKFPSFMKVVPSSSRFSGAILGSDTTPIPVLHSEKIDEEKKNIRKIWLLELNGRKIAWS